MYHDQCYVKYGVTEFSCRNKTQGQSYCDTQLCQRMRERFCQRDCANDQNAAECVTLFRMFEVFCLFCGG